MKLFLLVSLLLYTEGVQELFRFSKNTNSPLGLVIILNLPTVVSQKNALLSSALTEVG